MATYYQTQNWGRRMERERDEARSQRDALLAVLRDVFAYRYSDDERSLDAWTRARALLDQFPTEPTKEDAR